MGKTFLPPTNDVCEGYVFTGVCLSTGEVSVWAGGLCPWGSVSRGSLSGVLCPGVLCPWGSLSRAVSVICQGDATRMVTCGGTYPTGMHSCFKGISQWRIQYIQWSDLEGDARKVFSRNLHGQNCSGDWGMTKGGAFFALTLNPQILQSA